MLAVDPELSAVKLSGDLTQLKNETCRKMSWRIDDKSGDEDLEILSVSGKIVTFYDMPESLVSLSDMTTDDLSTLYTEGKNSFFCASNQRITGYWISQIMPDTNSVKLAGNSLTVLTNAIGKKFSYALSSGCDSEVLAISAVDTDSNMVYFNHALPKAMTDLSSVSETEMKLMFEFDDNAIYCPKDPDIGNVVVHNFYANHAEGGSSKAIGKYAHAEGRNAIADNRYSHAEGDGTFAGRMAAHAEGQNTKAYGYYSHSEGQKTYVANAATAAHAEGCQTSALGMYTHAAGYKACANTSYSYVWNGGTAEYVGHETGSFNVNPRNGLSGFWIGEQNLGELIGDIESLINSL